MFLVGAFVERAYYSSGFFETDELTHRFIKLYTLIVTCIFNCRIGINSEFHYTTFFPEFFSIEVPFLIFSANKAWGKLFRVLTVTSVIVFDLVRLMAFFPIPVEKPVSCGKTEIFVTGRLFSKKNLVKWYPLHFKKVFNLTKRFPHLGFF